MRSSSAQTRRTVADVQAAAGRSEARERHRAAGIPDRPRPVPCSNPHAGARQRTCAWWRLADVGGGRIRGDDGSGCNAGGERDRLRQQNWRKGLHVPVSGRTAASRVFPESSGLQGIRIRRPIAVLLSQPNAPAIFDRRSLFHDGRQCHGFQTNGVNFRQQMPVDLVDRSDRR